MSIKCELVRDRKRFDALAPAWQTLWRKVDASIFQSHAWISACLADHDRLNIALAWHGDELLAVLPLVVRRRAGVRMLEWAAQSYSDYCDAIVRPEADVLLELLWRRVRRAGGFDVVWLKQISPHARLLPLAQRMNGHSPLRTEFCLQVGSSQWSSGQAWFRTLNKKTRNDHLRGKRILAQMGETVFRELSEPLGPLLDWATRLKRQWLRTHKLESPIFDNGINLLPRMVQALAELGVLKIFLLECGGVPVAISINAVQDAKMLAFFATFDPEYDRGSPGIVLMTEYTMWAFDRGIKVVDYLRGKEPYKFKFADAMIELTTFAKAKTLRGRFAMWAYRMVQAKNDATQPVLGSAYLTAAGKSRRATPATE